MVSCQYIKNSKETAAHFVIHDSSLPPGNDKVFTLKKGYEHARREAFIQVATYLMLAYQFTGLRRVGRGMYAEPQAGKKGDFIRFSELHETVLKAPESELAAETEPEITVVHSRAFAARAGAEGRSR